MVLRCHGSTRGEKLQNKFHWWPHKKQNKGLVLQIEDNQLNFAKLIIVDYMLYCFFFLQNRDNARFSRMVSLTSSLCATLTALTMLLILFANFFFEANFGTCESSKWSNFPDFAPQHHVYTSNDSQRYLIEQNLVRWWGFYLWQKSPICHEFLIRDLLFSEKLCWAHIWGDKILEKKQSIWEEPSQAMSYVGRWY